MNEAVQKRIHSRSNVGGYVQFPNITTRFAAAAICIPFPIDEEVGGDYGNIWTDVVFAQRMRTVASNTFGAESLALG